MNYTKQDIRDRVCARSGIGTWSNQTTSKQAEIDDAISDAIRTICMDYQIPHLEATASISTSADTAFYDLPSDFDGFLGGWLRVANYHNVPLKSVAEMQEHYADLEYSGVPLAASEFGPDTVTGGASLGVNRLWLQPTPNTSYTVKYKYQKEHDDTATASFSSAHNVKFESIEPIVLKTLMIWRGDDSASKHIIWNQRFNDSVRIWRRRSRVIRRDQMGTIDTISGPF